MTSQDSRHGACLRHSPFVRSLESPESIDALTSSMLKRTAPAMGPYSILVESVIGSGTVVKMFQKNETRWRGLFNGIAIRASIYKTKSIVSEGLCSKKSPFNNVYAFCVSLQHLDLYRNVNPLKVNLKNQHQLSFVPIRWGLYFFRGNGSSGISGRRKRCVGLELRKQQECSDGWDF